MSSVGEDRRSEVALARELFDSFMSRSLAQLTYPFMEEVDPEALGLKDYRSIVTEPMWLKRMGEKFDQGVYRNIREFVCDFRLMLLNCYRYNGVTSRIGRMAEKMELLFEQKLQLMPPDIRAKSSIQATLGSGTTEDELSDCGLPRRRSSNRLFVSGDSRQLTPMRAIMDELEHAIQPGSGGVTASLIPGPNDSSGFSTSTSGPQSMSAATSSEERVAILVARLSLWRVRRLEEALLSTWATWWNDQGGPIGQEITDHTPELLEAYQFLWLSDPFLGISDSLAYCSRLTQHDGHINQPMDQNSRGLCLFDLELAFSVAPQASQLLATCMTILLATPKERGQFVAALSNATSASTCNDDTAADASNSSGRRSRAGANNLLASVKPLPYRVWERRLAARVESWYRVLWDRGKGRLLSVSFLLHKM
ncbi:unnamed protein product [Echinostoma caproni]|uniref:Bromo domain-containing protein n=1 Tax=Echinostoma caproni TaxID=27848 RepID=A0A183AZ83_9TREM|nr:unnamed protein product [Echinostoma caproni]